MAADITGILLASVVLGVGFLIIPARRRRAKAMLQEKIGALRIQLSTALRTEFEGAQEQSAHRLTDAIAPYARFVRAEEQRWREAQRTLAAIRDRMTTFLSQLVAAGGRSLAAANSYTPGACMIA